MTEEFRQLQASFEQDPFNPEVFQSLQDYYVHQTDWRALLGMYDRIGVMNGAADPDERRPFLEQLVRALREILLHLADREESGHLLVMLGDLYMALNQREEAMEAYQDSFRKNPRDITCLERARSIYRQSGDYERVIVLYDLECKVHRKTSSWPALGAACLDMATIFADHLDNPAKALELVLDAHAFAPQLDGIEGLFERIHADARIPAHIGQIIDRVEAIFDEDTAEAARLLTRAARLEHARAGGDPELAFTYASNAAELDPSNQDAIRLQAALLEAVDQAGDVASASARDDEDPQAHYQDVEELVSLDGIVEPEAAPAEAPAAVEDAPAEDTPAEDAPAEDAPAEDAPAEQDVEDEQPVAEPSVAIEDEAPAEGEVAVTGEDEVADDADAEPEEVNALLGAVEEDAPITAEIDAEASAAEDAPEADDAPDAIEDEAAEDADSAEEIAEDVEQSEEAEEGEVSDDVEEISDVEDVEEISDVEDVVEEVEEDVVEEVEEVEEAPSPAAAAARPPARPVSDDELAAALDALKKTPADTEALEIVQRGMGQREQWGELADLMEHSLKYLRRHDAEPVVMFDAAMIFWKHLGDLRKAEYYFKRLRRQDGDTQELLEFYEEFYESEGQWRKLHAHLGTLLEQADTLEEKRRITRRSAEIAERELNTPDKAVDAWRAFIDESGEDAEAAAEIRRIYEESERWPQLIDFIQSELDRAAEAGAPVEDQIALLEEIGGIYRDKITRGSDIRHIEILGRVLELDPEHSGAFGELRELLLSNRRFSELSDLLDAQAQLAAEAQDIPRATALLTEAADLWQDQLNNVTQALPFLQRILEIDPHDHTTRERLKDVYRQRRDYASLFGVLEQEAEGLVGGQLEDKLRELLELAQDRLHDADRAAPILEQLIELSPDEMDLYAKLEHLYRRADRLGDLAALLVRKSRLGLDSTTTIAILREAAELYEESLEEPDRAAALWAEILTLDPSHNTAFKRLSAIHVAARRFDDLEKLYRDHDALDRLFDVLDAEAGKTADADERRLITRRMATIAEQDLDDARRVILSLESLLEQGHDPVATARELIPWYRQTEDLAREIAMHELLLEHAADADTRFGELVELAALEIRREDRQRALRWQLDAVTLRPADEDTIARAEALAGDLEMTGAYLDHLELIADQQELPADLAELDPEAEDAEDVATRAALQESLWGRVARLARDEMGDHERAIELYERLATRRPTRIEHRAALEHLYDVTGQPERRIETLRALIHLLHEEVAPPEEEVAQLAKIAQVQHRQLGQTDAARETYEAILQLDPNAVAAVRGQRELLAAEGQWDDVTELYEREFDLLDPSDAEARATIRMQLASIAREFKEDAPRALNYYADILAERPDDEAALAAVEQLLDTPEVARDAALLIEPLFRDGEAAARLANALEARLRVTDDAYEAQDILDELVPLYILTLDDMEAAFPHASRRFALDASNTERWDELEALADALERWPEVEALMSAHAPFDGDEHTDRAELLRRVAVIREQYLDDAEGALAAYERLHALEPDDLSVVTELERLYRALVRQDALVRTLVTRADLITDGDAQVELLIEAATLTNDLLDQVDEAIDLYRRVHDIAPAEPRATEALEHLLRQTERWAELDELYGAQADLFTGRQRHSFLLRQVALRTAEQADPQGAFDVAQQLLVEFEHDADVIAALVRLDETLVGVEDAEQLRLDIAMELDRVYRALDKPRALIGALDTRLALADDPYDRLALLDELAELHIKRVGEPERAFARTREAVIIMPGEVERRERLERLADALQTFDQVVEAYLTAADQTDDELVACALFKRSGQLLHGRLERDEDAISAYERALEIEPEDAETLKAVEALYLASARNEALADNLRQQALLASGDDRLVLLARIGQLEEDILDRPEQAIDAYDELLQSDAASTVALEALDRLYRRQEQWHELADVLAQKANVLSDSADKVQAFHDLAIVQEQRLELVDDAIISYQQLRMLDAEHADALDALDRLYEQEARAGELSDVLRDKLRFLDPDAEGAAAARTTLELRLGSLLAEELMLVDEALDHLLAVFKREPGQPDALASLERFVRDPAYSERLAEPLIDHYQHERAWDDLIALYEVLRDESHDPAEQAEYNWHIAAVLRDEVQDLPRAQEALADAWRLVPERDDYRQQLTAIAEVEEAWQPLAEVYEDVLTNISDPDLLKPLRIQLARHYRDELQRPEDAELQFQEALTLDDQDQAVYAELEALLQVEERWRELIDLLDRRYMVFSIEPGAKRFLLQIAAIHDVQLEDGVAAVDAYRRVLDVDAHDDTAAAEINRLLRAQERWIDLADHLEDRVGLAETAGERVEIKTELAAVVRDQLHEPERALDIYRDVLVEHPFHEDTITSLEGLFAAEEPLRFEIAETLEPIYTELGRWPQYVSVLRDKIALEDDPYTRVELLRKVAHTAEHELRDHRAALRTWAEVVELVPQEAEPREHLHRLAERLRAFDVLVDTYERTLLENVDLGDFERAELLMELGRVLEERLDRLEDARDTFERALDADPERGAAYEAIERICARRKDWDELTELYRRRAESLYDPELQFAWYERLATLQEEILDRHEDALETYTLMLDLLPTEGFVHRALERLMASNGRFEELADLYDRLSAEATKPEARLEIQFKQAQLLEAELDRIDEAIDLYRVILLDHPAHRETLGALEGLRRDLSYRDGDWEMQLVPLIELLLEHYDERRDWRRIFELYEQQQELLEAPEDRIDLMLRAAQLVERHAEERADRFLAMTTYAQAFCIDPEHPDLFSALERIAEELDAWERLVPILLHALEDEEDLQRQGRLLSAAASIYLTRIKDRESALIAYEQALEADPEQRAAMLALEKLYTYFEYWEPLVILLGKRLDQSFPGDDEVHLLQRIASLYDETLRRPEQAIEAYEALRERDPAQPAYLQALARLYQSTEQHELLEEVLRELSYALTEPDQQLEVYRQLAAVQHHILERPEAAAETYNSVLMIEPDDLDAIESLIGIHQEAEAWHELIDMLQRKHDLMADDARDELAIAIGTIYLDELAQPYDAIDRFRTVAQNDPAHQANLAALGKLLDDDGVREDAFLTLEDAHQRAESWDALAGLYERRLTDADDPLQRVELFQKLARTQETRQSDPNAAFETTSRAFIEAPIEPQPRAELERLAEGLDAEVRLVAVYEQALDETGIDDPIVARDVHARLGQLYTSALDDPEAAINHWREVLDFDEYDAAALTALDDLYVRTEAHDDLIDVLERRVSNAPPETLNTVRFRLATLRETHEQALPDAFELYRQVLYDDWTHAGAIAAVERLMAEDDLAIDAAELLEQAYTQTERWPDLAGLFRKKLDTIDFAPDRADLLRRIATIELDRLDDLDAAFGSLGDALKAEPFDNQAQERLQALAAEHDRWRQLVGLYQEVIAVCEDDFRKMDLARLAAGWAKDTLKDFKLATTLYGIVLDVEPEDEQALGAIEKIAREENDLGALAEVLRRRADILHDPEEKFKLLSDLGETQIQLEDYPAATEAYAEARDLQPDDVEVLGRLVQLYEATEQHRDLADTLEAMIRLLAEQGVADEDLYPYHVRLGLTVKDHLDDAYRGIDALEAALKVKDDDMSVLRAVNALYEQTEQWEQLTDNLDRQLELATSTDDKVLVMVRQAEITYAQYGNADDAIALYESALALHPNHPSVEASLHTLYAQEGRWTDKFKLYYAQLQRASEPPKAAQIAIDMASLAAAEIKDLDTAVQYLGYALKQQPMHPEAMASLLDIHTQREAWPEVIKIKGQLIDASDDEAATIALRLERAAIADGKLNDPNAAADDYTEILNLQPEHEEAYTRLCDLLTRHESWDQLFDMLSFRADVVPEAQRKALYIQQAELADTRLHDSARRVTALEAAYAFDSADLDVVEPLLDAYIGAQQFDRAEPMLAEVIETLTSSRRTKEAVRFYHLSGKLAEQKGDEAAATEAFESAHRIDPTFVPNLLSLGKIAFRQEDWDKALKIFQAMLLQQMSIKDDRQKIDMYYHLGIVRQKKGDDRRAKEMFTRALGIDANHAPSQEALAALG